MLKMLYLWTISMYICIYCNIDLFFSYSKTIMYYNILGFSFRTELCVAACYILV